MVLNVLRFPLTVSTLSSTASIFLLSVSAEAAAALIAADLALFAFVVASVAAALIAADLAVAMSLVTLVLVA